MMGERILIAGPAWVGDMVMAQSLFKALRSRDPEAQIDVLAPAWSLPLLARMPEVHRGIEVPVGHGQFGLLARRALGHSLRAEHYDRAIVIPRSFKAALIPFFAGARRRSGYRGEMRYGLINDMRPLDKSVLRMTVQRYLALGQEPEAPLPPAAIPQPRLEVDELNRRRLLNDLGLEEGAVALLPGAEYGPAKQWPLESWAALAKKLSAAGYPVWLLGSGKDRPVGERIVELAGGTVRNLCGETELVDAVDLLSACAAAVSNDSGLMHVAAAVDLPLVGIYGSSTPDYTPPLSASAEVVYHRLECSPCFKRECPYGHSNCLTGIAVDEVWTHLQPQLESAK